MRFNKTEQRTLSSWKKEALILPTYGRSDKDIVNGEIQIVSTENSMGVVQDSKGMLDAVSDNLINETQIVCRMAMATLGERRLSTGSAIMIVMMRSAMT